MTTELLDKPEQQSMLHTMMISNPAEGTEIVTWNGDVKDREAAEAVFRAHMATGHYLAYSQAAPTAGATEAPPKQQIREFDAEAEKTWLVPGLAGG